MPLSDQQKFRAGRAILGWSQADLAKHAGVSTASISTFELALHKMIHQNKMACWRAFTDAGVTFTCDVVRYNAPVDTCIIDPGRGETVDDRQVPADNLEL